MATDIFAKLGDIKGESADTKHKGEIDVTSWSWGMTQTGSMATGGGGGTGKVSFHDLTFNHNFDKASPILQKACATGDHIKEGTITVRKAGKEQQEFLIIKMNEIIVTSVAPASGGEAISESVSLQFAKVVLEYKPQKDDGGGLDASVFFKYDIKGNKEG
jgi:type VI secretion system secreted protein Hcp